MWLPAGRSGTTGFVGGVLSLRGILAVLVATAHTLAFTVPAKYTGSVFEQAGALTLLAKVICDAVNVPMVFFVISGLAIARSLDRKQDFGQPVRSYFIFMARRVLRLYPAHTAATFGVIALAWLFLMGREPIDFSSMLERGVGFTSDWLNGGVFNPLKLKSIIGNFAIATWSMNPVVWSLFAEVCAVPILPLMHRVVREKNLATDLVMLAGLVVLAVLMWEHIGIRYWFSFYLGMLVQTRGRAFVEWLSRVTGGPGRASLLAWLVMLIPLVRPQEWMPATFIQGAGAFAIVSLVVWGEPASMSRLLDHPVLRHNGRLSYSFYLWHYIILTVVVRALYVTFGASVMLQHALPIFAGVEIFTIAAALAIAQLSHSCIEEPGILLGQRLEIWLRQIGRAPVGMEAD
jgi:peptidoglycan/LPS O-acetylase OafA/YrhL